MQPVWEHLRNIDHACTSMCTHFYTQITLRGSDE